MVIKRPLMWDTKNDKHTKALNGVILEASYRFFG